MFFLVSLSCIARQNPEGKLNEMRLAIDAMGGDNAPNAIIDGVYEAIEAFEDLSVTIVGDEEKIKPLLKGSKDRISILHTEEYISSEDQPVRAVRRRRKLQWFLR